MALTFEDVAEIKALPQWKKIESYVDSRVTQALATRAEKTADTADALLPRLAKIEATYTQKLRAAELTNRAVRGCFQRGLDPDLPDRLRLTFTDEADVDARLDALRAELEEMKARATSAAVADFSHKPSAGLDPSTPALDRFSQRGLNALEDAGQLDQLMRTGR